MAINPLHSIKVFKNIVMRNAQDLIRRFFLIISAGFLIVSCHKNEDHLAPMQMFSPGSFHITSGSESVWLTWDPSLYMNSTDTTISYTVQVSEDSTFQTEPLLVQSTDTTGIRFTDDTLAARQKYFARVKADATGDRPESRWVLSPSFRIIGIQLMIPGEIKVQPASVLLKWRVTPGLTSVLFSTQSSTGTVDTMRYAISETELASGTKEVDGLKANTSYHVELYNGKKSQGYADFKTRPAISMDRVVDLSEIQDRPEVLQDTLPMVEPGSTILLRRGYTYTLTTGYAIDKSLTIMSKPGFEADASVWFQGGTALDFKDGSQVDSLKFDQVNLFGEYGSNYVLNVSKSTAVGEIVFSECTIRNFRGIFRIKASSPVDITTVTYSDCIIDSINSYGILNMNNVAAVVHNANFLNSTISNCQIVLASKSASDAVTFQGCTIYNSPTSGKYLMDYGSYDVGVFTMQSCILGAANAVRGYRDGSNSTLSVLGTYSTSDYDNSGGNQIPGVTLYNQGSDEVFKDPEMGDFSIQDPNFPAVGDPRWLN